MHCPQMFMFAGAVCTARSSFRVCRCCMRCLRRLSWLQMLYTLPAQVFVVASVVYTSRSCFYVRKCCIHCPLVMFVVFKCVRICLPSQVLYTLPARVRRFVICSPFLCLKITSFLNFVILGPVTVDQLLTRSNQLIKHIPLNAGSGASSPCSFAGNAMFSSLFAVLE